MADFPRRDLVKILTGALDVQFKRIERTFATKDDLKRFATKEDLSSMEVRMNKRFSTKADLAQMEHNITTAVNQSQDAYVRRPEHAELKGRVAVLEQKISPDG